MVSYRIGRYVQKSGLIARSNKIENVALDNMPSIFYKIFTVFDNYENSSACQAANILWKLQCHAGISAFEFYRYWKIKSGKSMSR